MLIKGCEPFNLKLRYLLGLHGTTAYRLERESGGAISKGTIYTWLTGFHSPKAEEIIKLGNHIGFTCAEILFLWGRADIETTEEELARALNRSPQDIERAKYKVIIRK